MKEKEIIMTEGQARAMNAIRSGRNVFLSGEAGTGKSFVLNRFLEELPADSGTLVCAPTGIAAINIHGATMHRTFGIPIRPLMPWEEPAHLSNELLSARRIIIDEISMCRFDVFQYTAACILAAERKSGIHKQLILVGDFFQLPPVLTEKDREILCQLWDTDDVGDGFAFQAPLWKAFDFVNVILTEQVRQRDDADFVRHLNAIRGGDKAALDWFNAHAASSSRDGISLCPTNREAAAINHAEASRLKGEWSTFRSSCYGKVAPADKPTEDVLQLKPGMQVMTLVNDPEERFQNGSIGEIEQIMEEERSVVIRFENGQSAKVRPYVWEIMEPELNEEGVLSMKAIGRFIQLPIRIAYAITIHKSQGQTFSNVNLTPSCFVTGQLYVAISRLTSVSGLYLTSEIKPKYLKTSKEVMSFYRSAA